MLQAFKKVAVGLVVGLLATQSLFAQTEATSIAPIQNVFPHAFGSVMLRHFNEYTENESKLSLQGRYYLGSTFFDDLLKSQFILGVIKEPNAANYKKRDLEFENYLFVVSGKNLEITPFSVTRFSDDETKTQLSLNIKPKHSFSTHGGEIEIAAEFEAGFFTSNRNDQVVVEGNESAMRANLTKNDNNQFVTDAKANSGYTWVRTGVTYKPSFARGLGVNYRLEQTSLLSPKHIVDENNRVVIEKKNGVSRYDEEYLREHIFEIKYAFSNTVYAKNEFILKPKFENKDQQYKNILSLVADVF